ncbi:hypothetical protein A5634_10535 [Mycobacterium asiaticum]|uniref:PE domain-containing protein n=1 Tax=Mycobacterium asiaticum TaxID=1790 RepID=A0A1A3NIT1_MYCAS|nr:hypothetical protein [Mycobacterium asiaticum]OBK21240.1 hypothetical protein A5634_10535 [Mycobacterium asiaticum]
MTDQVLQADLDALGRLRPQISALVWQVTQGLPHEIPAGGTVDADAVPSLVAAQQMSTRTLPVVKTVVAGRFTKVAEMIDLARRSFLASEEELLTVVNKVPTLLRPPTSG